MLRELINESSKTSLFGKFVFEKSIEKFLTVYIFHV